MTDAAIDSWQTRIAAALLVTVAAARVRHALGQAQEAVREVEAMREVARGALADFHAACDDAERAATMWGAANEVDEWIEFGEILAGR
jgi:hypothetical protein